MCSAGQVSKYSWCSAMSLSHDVLCCCRKDIVEYRSASRIGESDGDINRKRIKAIRLELQKKGWQSIGF